MAHRVGPDQPYEHEGGPITELEALEAEQAVLHYDLERTRGELDVAFGRIKKLEEAIRTLAADPGSPFMAARAARDVLDGDQ